MKPQLLLLFTIAVAFAARVEIGGREAVPEGWTLHNAPLDHTVKFDVLLKQQNLDKLNAKFWAVSNPKNEDYGNFLTMKEALDLIAPAPAAMDKVEAWLSSYPGIELKRWSDHFEVKAPLAVAEKMLEARFMLHKHIKGDKLVRAHGKITVPESVARYIDFIAGATELITSSVSGKIKPRPRSSQEEKMSAEFFPAPPLLITPSVLKGYYNVPANQISTNPATVNGIAAFNDRYDPGAFETFKKVYNLSKFDTYNFGPTDGSVADFVESDLDVQYISAMNQGADLYFVQEPGGYWILQFIIDATKNLKKTPTVFSISYGWFELDQCLWASVNCPRFGYNGQQYVNRTDTAFQVFGASGVSVFVADGDDGSPSYNCPVDGRYPFCPGGQCVYNTTECAALTFKSSKGDVCNLPALAQREQQPGCGAISPQTLYTDGPKALIAANPKCNLKVNYGTPTVSSCACEDIKPVTVNGVTISGYKYDASNGPVFGPIWPGSSPYVTSVSASLFLSADGIRPFAEVVSSSATGAIFTTGGGFSYFQSQASYQAKAVAQWKQEAGDKAPPSWAYDSTKRGYPDISFNGNNYDVYLSTTQHQPIGGTSASSPAAAGLFNLINDVLINNKKTTLGFLNPLLYQMAEEDPETFNDITSGDNKCDGYLCCQYGYVATPGWDPVSGLGSPNFPEILRYVKRVKGINN